MTRVYNFSAGPAALPESVLQQAQAELLDYQGQGLSIMEMSHRGEIFSEIAQRAEQDLRELLAIPSNYQVLFMQGGASVQFSAVPMNLLGQHTSVDYIDTGIWSKKAIQETKKYTSVNIAASSAEQNYFDLPQQWNFRDDAAYVHHVSNETIGGLEFLEIPDVGNRLLVADMSSTILSRPIDVSRYGLIYAGAQKNIGPSGLTIVIVREDLLDRALSTTPAPFNYAVQAANQSMYNTPPTFAWYLAGLVFQWLKNLGGLSAMAAINQRKADALYAAIDASELYNNPIALSARSWMNIPFTLQNESLNAAFLQGAKEQGLLNLKGHKSVGGMRASIYNAVPEAGVMALIDYMKAFERANL